MAISKKVTDASRWLAFASSAISVRDAKPVPADELYAFQSKPKGDSGKITVVRDSEAVGSGCDIVTYVDSTAQSSSRRPEDERRAREHPRLRLRQKHHGIWQPGNALLRQTAGGWRDYQC